MLLADASALRLGLDELDEGYFVEQASRAWRGELPFRDFDALYTPGLLALHTALFQLLGGPDLVAVRLASLVGRALLALALFAVGRQVATPGWALLPPLVVLLGLDTVPVGWEPHPGWWSTAAAVVSAWFLLRAAEHPRTPARWWLLAAAGAACGVAFAFKQNTGIFAALAAGVFLVCRGLTFEPAIVTRATRALQLVAVVGLLAVAGWLTRPYLDVWVVVLVLSPLAAAALGLLRDGAIDRAGLGPLARLRLLVPFGAGFGLVTVAWLVPLLVALEGRATLLSSFVGALDQAVLFSPLQLPDPRLWLFPPPEEAPLATLLLTPERLGFGVASLLPAMAAWAGAALCWRLPPARRRWRLEWLLTAGALALLTQYPRLDVYHLAWSAPLLLVVGAAVLGQLRHRAMVAAGLTLAVLATLPGLYLRASAYVQLAPESGRPERIWLLTLTEPPRLAGFRMEITSAWQIRDVLAAIDELAAPREPIFVYPSSPLLYVLADRPNPTRYSHIYPYLRPADAAALIETLDRAHVRTIVLSDAWLDFWTQDDANPALTAYFKTQFAEARRVGVYRLLHRVGDASTPAS